ncbi:MAG TPA: FG-GAP-like repeat-containing protein [Oryzihumus sp.]|nr:FG-GAP-like repeat-containing protein [Oryzihumus sp.]
MVKSARRAVAVAMAALAAFTAYGIDGPARPASAATGGEVRWRYIGIANLQDESVFRWSAASTGDGLRALELYRVDSRRTRTLVMRSSARTGSWTDHYNPRYAGSYVIREVYGQGGPWLWKEYDPLPIQRRPWDTLAAAGPALEQVDPGGWARPFPGGPAPHGPIRGLDYSPDGRFVVTAFAPTTATSSVSSLWVAPADGALPAAPTFTVAGSDLTDPVWSPDGRMVAFTATDRATHTPHVHVVWVAPRGTGSSTMAAGPVFAQSQPLEHPAWRSDSAAILAARPTGGLAMVGLSAGEERLLRPTGTSPVTSSRGDVAWTEPGPDNLLLRGKWDGSILSGTAVAADFLGNPPPSDFRFSPEARPRLAILYGGFLQFAEADATGAPEPGRCGQGASPGTALPCSRFALRRVLTPGTSDYTGDGQNDLVTLDRGGYLRAYPVGSTSVGADHFLGYGFQGATAVVAAGDLAANGIPDVLSRDAQGRLWLHPGTFSTTGLGVHLDKPVRVGTAWKGLAIAGGGDYTGDHHADVLATDPYGQLWVYPVTNDGSRPGGIAFGPHILAGTGFTGLTVVCVGDITGDGRDDVVTLDRGGRLALRAGLGGGHLAASRPLASGWTGTRGVVGVEQVGSGAYGQLAVKDAGGTVTLRPTNGYGSLTGTPRRIVTGWAAVTLLG